MSEYLVETVVNPDGVEKNCRITVEGEKITAVEHAPVGPVGSDGTFSIAIPGFIDLHTHGGMGHDIMDGGTESFSKIAEHHLSNGTTSFLGSTLTADSDVIESTLSELRGFIGFNAGESGTGHAARMLGVHLEGPWISPEKAGAQNPRFIHAPDERSVELVHEFRDIIRKVTFSYHYDSADMLLDKLKQDGIVAACGHDSTTDERILAGFERGIDYVTHLYCMSSSFQRVGGYKHLGTLEMALMTPGVSVEVIADGRHITKYFWDFICHNKSLDDLVIVSDSMRWAGLPPDPDTVVKVGEYEVVIDDGVAWLPDRSAFAGSTATIHSMFRRLVNEWGVSLQDAVRITSWNQAKILGVSDTLGAIRRGMTADMLLLDENLDIAQVVKSGTEVAT